MKIIVALLINFAAMAFTINANIPIRFANPEIRVHIANNACANVTDTADEIMDLVEIAVNEYWNKISTSSLHLKGGDLMSVAAAYTTDQICSTSEPGCTTPVPSTNTDILIVCNGNTSVFTSTGILAVTLPNNLSGTTIRGAVIGINDIAGTRYNTQTREQKISLFAHEIGHAFGLGHSSVKDSLMYFQNLTGRETIGRDDWDGATYLYPKDQLPICGSIDVIDDRIDNGGNEIRERSSAKDSVGFMAGLAMLILGLLIGNSIIKKSFVEEY